MGAQVLDGKACAADVEAALAPRIAALAAVGVVPHLAVILASDDPASAVYVGAKGRACERLGIRSTTIRLDPSTSRNDLIAEVERLNADPEVHGILIQSPLPEQHDEFALAALVRQDKDVDGFHPSNLGLLVQGRADGLMPCTPAGVIRMLEWAGQDMTGKQAVVLGRSRIVGMPLALMLARKGVDATVTIGHSRTPDLAAVAAEADLIVAAVGRPELVTSGWVKPGAVIVDVGVNRVDDATRERGYRLTGDVDPAVDAIAGWRSPVPGGVGPMTIAMLMENTVRATELQQTA